MARSTSTIHDGMLLSYEGEQEIAIVVGSEQWFEWLGRETSTIFSFRALDGAYTARKERAGNHRGGWYWKAYRKDQGRLYRAYLGKPEDLTMARLNEIAQTLAARIQERAKKSQHVVLADHGTHQRRRYDASVVPLLETKLHPPRLSSRLVERAHLLTLLDAGRELKLTILQAPAGFGKTTLIAQWITHRQQQAAVRHRSSPVAWLSLDSGDNDPVRFWSSLIISCQTCDLHVGEMTLGHLSQLPRSPFSSLSLETGLTFLLNDLAHSENVELLVLEDYHLIEHPRIHETLAFFIERLPTNVHVVLLTRSEPSLPLVRWRARGELLEVQSSQLRFSAEETATFLRQLIPQALSEDAVGSLHTYLEGWVAGMRLLVLSLQGHMLPQALEDMLMHLQADSTIDRKYRSIQEYFLDEVFHAQPEALQWFLLQTCVLGRLNGSLCDAVTDQQGSARWLEMAERSGFLLEALDGNGLWYRYHGLFADAIRVEAARRLGKEALYRLSARASRWYEDRGMVVEAIEAALSAQEPERAAHLIERQNENAYFSEYHTMQRWLEQLPEPVLHDHPALCFLLALARFFSEDTEGAFWRIEPIEALLRMAEEGWRKREDFLHVGILYAFRATFTVVHGFIAPAVVYAQQALQFLPSYKPSAVHPVEWIEWRCGCLIVLGLAAMQEGVFDAAHQHMLEAYALSLNNEDRVFTRVVGRLLADICVELGELHQADSYYQQVLAEVPWPDERGEGIFRIQIAGGRMRLFYEWNMLDQAEEAEHEAATYPYRGDFPYGEEDARTRVELLKLLLLHARGKTVEVQTGLSTLYIHLQAAPHTIPLSPEVLIWQARLQIRDGDILAGERTLGALINSEKELSLQQRHSLHLLQARLHLGRGEAEAALPLLEQLLASAQHRKHTVRALEIQLLIALTYAALKQRHPARQQLSEVLAQTYREGFQRLFLDEGEPMAALLRSLLPSLTEQSLRAYAKRLLHAFATTLPAHAPNLDGGSGPLLEPLSAQEQRVLTLLVAGRSNPEMAEILVVSVNTIKGHVKNIYRKLNVTNRIEAAEVARHLQLV